MQSEPIQEFSIRNLFLGRVYAEGLESLADGGEECYKQMSNTYRISVFLSISLIHYFIYKSLTNTYMNQKNYRALKPSLLEKFVGLVQILVTLLQFTYKALTFRLIFMLSCCHLCTFLQGLALISTPSKWMGKVYVVALVWSTGAFMGVVYPETGLITLPGELELFWVQHLVTGIFGPLLLVYTDRYECIKDDFFTILYGFSIFSWFIRLIQGFASILTWANVNYQLCFPDEQILFTIFGVHYLYMTEIVILVFVLVHFKTIFLVCRLGKWVLRKTKLE